MSDQALDAMLEEQDRAWKALEGKPTTLLPSDRREIIESCQALAELKIREAELALELRDAKRAVERAVERAQNADVPF